MEPFTLMALLGGGGGGSAPNPAQITTQLPSLLYRSITGYKQRKAAKQALRELEGTEPAIEVPASIRQRAQEPISQQLMSAQQEADARRTAQSIGALQKAGARGILGGVQGVVDAERVSERNRMAGYEQARRDALAQLGVSELDVQNRKMSNYLSKMSAAQRALEAGQQNIAGVFDTISGLGQQSYAADLQSGNGTDYSKLFAKMMNKENTVG